jgi:hypothetical protein
MTKKKHINAACVPLTSELLVFDRIEPALNMFMKTVTT